MNYAIQETLKKSDSSKLPVLLQYYKDLAKKENPPDPLKEYNMEHSVPEKYEKLLKEELQHER